MTAIAIGSAGDRNVIAVQGSGAGDGSLLVWDAVNRRASRPDRSAGLARRRDRGGYGGPAADRHLYRLRLPRWLEYGSGTP